MSKKGTPRKNTKDFNDEHERFLELVGEKRPEVEIAALMNLSTVQLKAHTLKALQSELITAADLKPSYEAVYAQSLPAVIRERMSLASKDDAKALVKIELQDGGVLLTLLRAAPPRQDQPAPESTEEPPVTDNAEEESA